MRTWLWALVLGLLTIGWTAATPTKASARDYDGISDMSAQTIPVHWGGHRGYWGGYRGYYPGYRSYYRGYYPYGYGNFYYPYNYGYRSFYYPYSYGSYYSPYSYYGGYYNPGFSFWIW